MLRSRKRRLSRLAPLAVACLLLAGGARAEMIRELVTVQNTVPIQLEGIGIVTGLTNTGDKRDAAQIMLREYLKNNELSFDDSSLAIGNIAFVRVTAELPPYMRPGQKFPVSVSSIGDAKSLKGGTLLRCSLYDGSDRRDRQGRRIPMGEATGPVVVGADSLTRGRISVGQNSGATSLDVYPFGEVVNKDWILRLNLNRPNWSDASAIARQINQTPSLNPNLQDSFMFAEAAPSEPVAYAKDMVQVLVKIPEQYRHDVASYIDNIMKVPVPVDRPAMIVINRAKNSIVVTGDIRVNNAAVSLQDKMVTVRPATAEEPPAYVLENDTPRNMVELDGPGTYADLQGLIDTLNAMGLTTEQVIAIFEELHTAKAINAEFIVE